RIRFACAEIGQRSWRRVCRGRTGNAGCGKPASRAGCDPSLGQHGGAPSLAQFSRLSGRAQGRREIREIQHRRGQWPKIAVAHSRPRDAKGDPDLGGRDADTGRLWHVRGLMYYGAQRLKTKSRALTRSWQGKEVLCTASPAGLPPSNLGEPPPPGGGCFFESVTIKCTPCLLG